MGPQLSQHVLLSQSSESKFPRSSSREEASRLEKGWHLTEGTRGQGELMPAGSAARLNTAVPSRGQSQLPQGHRQGTNTFLHDTPARQAESWCHYCLVVGKATVSPPSLPTQKKSLLRITCHLRAHWQLLKCQGLACPSTLPGLKVNLFTVWLRVPERYHFP